MDAKETIIQLNPEQLRKLQMEMLELLIELDRICRKHKIKYFLSSGTLLGAVRHQGFIPWDDDVDVEMLRGDYERFCDIWEMETNNNKFFFQTYKTDRYYNWFYGKFRLKNTEYVRAGQAHLKSRTGICIDVFPIDNISENKLIQKFVVMNTYICRKILWSPVGSKIIDDFIERYFFKMLSLIPRNLALQFYQWITNLYNDKQTKELGFFGYPISGDKGCILKYKWYEDCIECDFEKHKFFIPIGYKEILYFQYDDYMQLPPVEKRYGNSPAEYIKFQDGKQVGIKI